MEKLLITGGSGFIGTNLIEKLRKEGKYELMSIDIVAPKIDSHKDIWKQVDLRKADEVMEAVMAFMPDYVIALGARTDLNGKTLDDYNANIGGVKNVLVALEKVANLKRLIYASSMYVCEPGYMPKDFEDYAPHTLYGESKVETEKIIKGFKSSPSTGSGTDCSNGSNYCWTIIRPTSIWGPWFGEPYDKFFRIVMNRMYFHMGERACKKTYGYIDNALYQILSILNAPEDKVNKKVFYLGDYEAYDITEWSNEIARECGFKIPRIPYFCFMLAGWFGDFLKLFGIHFPMTSFRLHNMTTDNVHTVSPIQELAPNLPVSRVEGTKRTLDWIRNVKMKK